MFDDSIKLSRQFYVDSKQLSYQMFVVVNNYIDTKNLSHKLFVDSNYLTN